MAIEKSLYAAPQGIEDLLGEPEIEIEIEDPESVTISMGGLEIEIDAEDDEFNINLAEEIDDGVLQSLAEGL